MLRRTVSAIMLTLILTSILPLAFNVQPVETEPSTLTVSDESATMQEAINVASLEPPQTEWNQTYGEIGLEWAYSVVQTDDGGYAIAGETWSFGAGYNDYWLIKTDSSGNILWNKTYGGTSHEIARSVIQTDDGGYAIAGYTFSFGAGQIDSWLVKTDSYGNALWNKTYGGIYCDYGQAVVQTGDGGYAIAGTYSFVTGLDEDFWLVKTDSAGNMLWNKTYGGTDCDVATSVQQTSDGGYVLAGYTFSFGAGQIDSWLVKTDSAGNALWNKTYGGTRDDGAYSVICASDGGYAFAGFTASYGSGGGDFWLVKIDSLGNIRWSRTYGGALGESAHSIVETNDGGYVLAGRTNSHGAGDYDFWLIKVGRDISRMVKPVEGFLIERFDFGEDTGYAGHEGIDIDSEIDGKEVVAAADGIVAHVHRQITSGAGLWVWIWHGEAADRNGVVEEKISTRYLHLKDIPLAIQPGTKVYGGETVIGKVSNTGSELWKWPFGSHLHFEVRQGGSLEDITSGKTSYKDTDPLNPLRFVEYKDLSTKGDSLIISAHSLIDLVVTDPDGFVVSKDVNELPDTAWYFQMNPDEEGNSGYEFIAFNERKLGNYLIEVIPEPNATATDPYTLKVSAGNITIVLAEEVPIGDIPDQPYVIESTETGIIPEFPSSLTLPIFIILTLLAVILYKRKQWL